MFSLTLWDTASTAALHLAWLNRSVFLCLLLCLCIVYAFLACFFSASICSSCAKRMSSPALPLPFFRSFYFFFSDKCAACTNTFQFGKVYTQIHPCKRLCSGIFSGRFLLSLLTNTSRERKSKIIQKDRETQVRAKDSFRVRLGPRHRYNYSR